MLSKGLSRPPPIRAVRLGTQLTAGSSPTLLETQGLIPSPCDRKGDFVNMCNYVEREVGTCLYGPEALPVSRSMFSNLVATTYIWLSNWNWNFGSLIQAMATFQELTGCMRLSGTVWGNGHWVYPWGASSLLCRNVSIMCHALWPKRSQ